MTRVVTEYEAFGVYRDEALTRQPFQFLRLKGTAAATDTAFDLGTFAGTFWGQVDDTATGLAALKALKDINTKLKTFHTIGGLGVIEKTKIGASLVIVSGAVGSGSASATVTATGLLTTDTIVAVTQRVKGANSLPLLGWSGQLADQLTAVYSADPGANAILDILVQRENGVPGDGQVKLAMDGTNTLIPNLTYKSADAPTAFDILLGWLLKEGEQPTFDSGAA